MFLNNSCILLALSTLTCLAEIISTAYPGVKKGDLLYDFIDAIVQDRVHIVSKKDIFDVMSICFAMEQSNQTKKAVKVEYI